MALLPHVRHDPSTSAAAASACRDGAADLRAAASVLTGAAGTALAVWAGRARTGFDHAADELVTELLAEATRLDGTADALDGATSAAVRESIRRIEAAEAERRRREAAAAETASSCTPGGGR